MSNFKSVFVVLGGMAVTGLLGAAAISPAEAGSSGQPTVSKGAPAARGPIVRDHREPKPVASNGAPAARGPIVRDHREPRVRNHRN